MQALFVCLFNYLFVGLFVYYKHETAMSTAQTTHNLTDCLNNLTTNFMRLWSFASACSTEPADGLSLRVPPSCFESC